MSKQDDSNLDDNNLVRWYHHPKIFPWITQFTLIEWLSMGGACAYVLYCVWVMYAG